MSMRGALKAALGAIVLTAASVGAQEARPTVPQIVVSASGEVKVAPDKATISIGVQTRSTTAAAASQQNAQKQRAIIDAIKAKGIPAEQISTSNFNVIPETRYDREGQAAPRTTSYLVMNTVNVELKRIDQVGPMIDAALGAGANQINSLSFGVQNADSARRAALNVAVTKARADAESVARAAGGSLGPMIELVANESSVRPPVPYMREMAMSAAKADGTPIEAGMETVIAHVSVRWTFVSGPPR
jgi:uncharacterized protein YggE